MARSFHLRNSRSPLLFKSLSVSRVMPWLMGEKLSRLMNKGEGSKTASSILGKSFSETNTALASE